MNKHQSNRQKAKKGKYERQYARVSARKAKNKKRNEEIRKSALANRGVRHPWHKDRKKEKV